MNRLILCFVALTSCCLNQNNSQETLTVMSWNVQNLFNGEDNGVEYDEFSVQDGLWSSDLYNTRLKKIVKIIELNSPDVIGFQEIEGLVVLEDLQELMPEYKYAFSTDDPGPIQSGFLSVYPIIKTGILTPDYPGVRLRSMLEITIQTDRNQLVLINNHWKSKSGGFSEHLRISSSKALKKRLLELKDKEVLLLGDFNENYNEYQLRHKSYDTALMYDAEGDGLTLKDGNIMDDQVYTPWTDSDYQGSYMYNGSWETIDNFFLNKKLLNDEGFMFSEFYVDTRDLLFTASGDIKKWITEYSSGYSDHLPIVIKLEHAGITTTLE